MPFYSGTTFSVLLTPVTPDSNKRRVVKRVVIPIRLWQDVYSHQFNTQLWPGYLPIGRAANTAIELFVPSEHGAICAELIDLGYSVLAYDASNPMSVWAGKRLSERSPVEMLTDSVRDILANDDEIKGDIDFGFLLSTIANDRMGIMQIDGGVWMNRAGVETVTCSGVQHVVLGHIRDSEPYFTAAEEQLKPYFDSGAKYAYMDKRAATTDAAASEEREAQRRAENLAVAKRQKRQRQRENKAGSRATQSRDVEGSEYEGGGKKSSSLRSSSPSRSSSNPRSEGAKQREEAPQSSAHTTRSTEGKGKGDTPRPAVPKSTSEPKVPPRPRTAHANPAQAGPTQPPSKPLPPVPKPLPPIPKQKPTTRLKTFAEAVAAALHPQRPAPDLSRGAGTSSRPKSRSRSRSRAPEHVPPAAAQQRRAQTQTQTQTHTITLAPSSSALSATSHGRRLNLSFFSGEDYVRAGRGNRDGSGSRDASAARGDSRSTSHARGGAKETRSGAAPIVSTSKRASTPFSNPPTPTDDAEDTSYTTGDNYIATSATSPQPQTQLDRPSTTPCTSQSSSTRRHDRPRHSLDGGDEDDADIDADADTADEGDISVSEISARPATTARHDRCYSLPSWPPLPCESSRGGGGGGGGAISRPRRTGASTATATATASTAAAAAKAGKAPRKASAGAPRATPRTVPPVPAAAGVAERKAREGARGAASSSAASATPAEGPRREGAVGAAAGRHAGETPKGTKKEADGGGGDAAGSAPEGEDREDREEEEEEEEEEDEERAKRRPWSAARTEAAARAVDVDKAVAEIRRNLGVVGLR